MKSSFFQTGSFSGVAVCAMGYHELAKSLHAGGFARNARAESGGNI